MDLTGMMVSPDGTATPMDPVMLGDGDTLGDGQLGPTGEGDGQVQEDQVEAEASIRQSLVTQAYGTTIPSRSTVDKD
jgi:hypothetical protein